VEQKVAATEDIFVYLANAAGLDLVSPPAFTAAVAEGTIRRRRASCSSKLN